MHGFSRSGRIGLLFVLAACIALPEGATASASYNGTRGLIRTKSADTFRKGSLSFQLSSNYGKQDNEELTPVFFGSADSATVDYHMFITRATITYALSDFFEIAGDLEVRNWIRTIQEQSPGASEDTYTRGGLGDTDVSAKLNIPIPSKTFKLGAYGNMLFKTGDKDKGFSTDANDITILGLATIDLSDLQSFVPTRIHFNAGYRLNKNEKDGYGIFDPNFPDTSGFNPPGYPAVPTGESDSYNDEFLFNTAVEFPAPSVTFFVEFDMHKLTNVTIPANVKANASTYTLTPGVEFKGKGSSLELGADINLNSGDMPSVINAPDWGLWIAFNYVAEVVPRDSDKDGIADDVDGCPDQAEDIDGHDDKDGCPDLDNDGDGLPDKADMCPDLAEDVDSFEDGDGCPDLDNDQDGIPDLKDKCPGEPEDFDGEMDDDGCPDLVKDSDNDGVADDIDRCPLQAEDVDGYQDDDGCPDLDNDLDGIPDAQDKCPTQPETFNNVDDTDGCPDAKEIGKQFILRGINFESGSAALTPDSHPVLDQVIASLNSYPEVRLEIRGHTDSQGPAAFNLQLSQKRAESVRQYLINGGIAADRITAIGVGEEEPISSNGTAEGRSQNRRIEFKRLN
jgi:outer membrane protein OmpA-like peptidoglycan-associated protein